MGKLRRIAILSVHTSPLAALGGKKTGGMNVYIRALAAEFASRGIQVDIFTRRVNTAQPDVEPVPGGAGYAQVVHVNAGPTIVLDPSAVYPHLSQFTAGVIAYATRHNVVYDLVYSHYWLSGWVASKLKEVWGTPFIQMFHTLGHMKQRIGAGKANLPDVRIATETRIVNEADRIIAATQAEVEQLLWLYRADRRKIEVVPPGVDAARFRPISQREAREQVQLDDVCHLLLFVGRPEPLKAVDTILQALDRVRTTDASVFDTLCFAVIGGNPNDPADQEMVRLNQLTEKLVLSKNVRFLGAKEHTLLPLYYAAATAVIMPSDYESFGMVALEAMASGTPVIATQVGGLAFLVRDAHTGYHVPVRDPEALADRIVALITESALREELARNAVEVAQSYRWSHIADRLLQVFGSVISAQYD